MSNAYQKKIMQPAKQVAKDRFQPFSGFVSRVILIKEICRGKKVLDIGSIDHDLSAIEVRPDWLFAQIQAVASSVTGIDINKEQVTLAQQKGFPIFYGDIENLNLNENYDVIVLGEIIEHLNNVGTALEHMARHLVDGGRIVLTTPNPYGLYNIVRIFLKKFPKINPEHTLYLDPCVFDKLIRRYGLKIDKIYINKDNYLRGGRMLRSIYFSVLKLRPYLADDYIYILSKA